MRRTLLYLTVVLGLLISIIAVVLFVPSVSRYLIEQLSHHYLGHTVTLQHYRLTPMQLFADGTFDDNSSVQIRATELLSSQRTVQMHFEGTASLFNTLLEQNLSALPLKADLDLAGTDLHLQSQLLNGFLDANFSLETTAYRFTLTHIDLPELLAAFNLPDGKTGISTGTLEVSGFGIGDERHESTFKLHNITMPDILPSAELDGNVSLSNATLLRSSVLLHSKRLNARIDTLLYDLQNGMFSFSLTAENRDPAWVPLRHLTVMGTGVSAGEGLKGTLLVEADDVQCLLSQIMADLPQARLHAKYRLTTLSQYPLNLVGPNALSGDLAYVERVISADVRTRSSSGPLLTLRYAGDRLQATSRHLPLPLIASIANRQLPVTGNVDFNASVDMGTPYPTVAFEAASRDIALSKNAAELSGMTAPFNVNLKVKTLSGREYKADVSLNSDQLRDGAFGARFDPQVLSGSLQGHIAELTTPWYKGRDLRLQSEADLKNSRIRYTEITSENEQITLPELNYADGVNGSLYAAVKKLDRFFPDADPSLVLEGNASFITHSDTSEIDVAVRSVGKAHATLSAEGKSLSAEGIELAGLFALTGQTPPPITGTAALTALLDRRSATFRLTSDGLTPSSELNGTLSPFPLDINATLLHCGSRYFGGAEARAGGDRLSLTSLDIDTADRRLTSHYRLEMPDGNRSVVQVPESILVLPLEANGKLAFSDGRTDLTLHTGRLALGHDIHRVLERNATGTLPLVLDMNLTHAGQRFSASGNADARPAFLLPFSFDYNASTRTIRVDASERSAEERNETLALHLLGTLGKNTLENARLSAQTERFNLHVRDLFLDPDRDDFRGDFRLGVLPQNSRYTREAYLNGTVRTKPRLDITLQTEDMEGNLSAVMNQDLLILHVADLSLPHVLGYVQAASPIESGTLSGNIILNTPPLIDGNLSRLSGGVDLRLDNVVVVGFNIDDRLQTLQDSQDFSLFQGSLYNMPLVRSLVSLPDTLFERQAIKSRITVSRYALAISGGKAVCVDCASATPKHRVAAAGDINLVTQHFDAFYLALLNPQGCPYYMQRIRGPITNPRVNLAASGVKVVGGAVLSVASNVTDAANFLTKNIYRLTSATGEIISYVPIAGTAVDKTVNSVTGTLYDATSYVSQCTPFYLGSVPAPLVK